MVINIQKFNRSKFTGFISLFLSLGLGLFFIYSLFLAKNSTNTFESINLGHLNNFTYYALTIPLLLVSLFIIGTGFWIGWTILTIKVVPPMPEIVETKDYAKIKALILCLITFFLGVMLIYGIYKKNFRALAIPATVISFIILGAIFWVGLAIITTRNTLEESKKES